MTFTSKLKAFWARYLACLKNPAANPAWQTAHAVAGFAFPWVGAGIGGIYAAAGNAASHHQVLVCVLGFAALASLLGDVLWVLPKEFIYDIKVEGATDKGGWEDALHYWIPSLVSWGIIVAISFVLGAH